MAVTGFAGQLDEQLIVYDCMDELSLFRGAPPELVRRERELLAVADVVFAGGPKIWQAKRELNANCFCYGCGVDAKHFGGRVRSEAALPNDMADLPRPIFGYIGVVDERIDYELLEHLADSTRGSVDNGWALDKSRSWFISASRQFALARRTRLLGPATLREGIRRLHDAFRDERSDAFHQSDKSS